MKWFRSSQGVLFCSYMLFSLIILFAVHLWHYKHWSESFRQYQNDNLVEDASRIARHMMDQQIMNGKFNAGQVNWLDNEAELYQVYMKYVNSDKHTVWYDSMAGAAQQQDAFKVEVPLVDRGELAGYLSIHYRSASNHLSLPNAAYRENMNNGLRKQLIIEVILVILACYLVSLLQTVRTRRLNELVHQVRTGNKDLVIPVKGVQELKLIAMTLNELTAELRRQDELRGQLMQDLTHEFRTPITSMLTEIEAIMDGIYEVSDERLQEIYEELERLTRLVNDVEQLFEAEGAKAKLNLVNQDIVRMANSVFKNFLPVARDKQINFVFANPHIPCFAEVDHDRMIQIISNLVTNAVKFTASQGEITLGVWCSEWDVTIYCKDNGIGIAEKDLQRIFERFYRANRFGTKRISGLGVGLSICKALTEAHDGFIEVESELNSGSTFAVTMPKRHKQDDL